MLFSFHQSIDTHLLNLHFAPIAIHLALAGSKSAQIKQQHTRCIGWNNSTHNAADWNKRLEWRSCFLGCCIACSAFYLKAKSTYGWNLKTSFNFGGKLKILVNITIFYFTTGFQVLKKRLISSTLMTKKCDTSSVQTFCIFGLLLTRSLALCNIWHKRQKKSDGFLGCRPHPIPVDACNEKFGQRNKAGNQQEDGFAGCTWINAAVKQSSIMALCEFAATPPAGRRRGWLIAVQCWRLN